jgi:hypothetical protein
MKEPIVQLLERAKAAHAEYLRESPAGKAAERRQKQKLRAMLREIAKLEKELKA